ncbi:hypothetical protein SDC9_115167 [bioreactor metagenome]|uniref:Uncharacterized protein n=1 Tax=bioreactor metagenome TaxID=1076179 RepID=A0A645BS84_9ZZZZ
MFTTITIIVAIVLFFNICLIPFQKIFEGVFTERQDEIFSIINQLN